MTTCPLTTYTLDLKRRVAAIVVADADRVRHLEHEDLAVADFARACRRHQRPHHFFLPLVRHHHLKLYLGQQIHLVLHSPVNLRVSFLTPVAAHFRDRHPVHADRLQCFLHFLEFERLNDGFDSLHTASLSSHNPPQSLPLLANPSIGTPYACVLSNLLMGRIESFYVG